MQIYFKILNGQRDWPQKMKHKQFIRRNKQMMILYPIFKKKQNNHSKLKVLIANNNHECPNAANGNDQTCFLAQIVCL